VEEPALGPILSLAAGEEPAHTDPPPRALTAEENDRGGERQDGPGRTPGAHPREALRESL